MKRFLALFLGISMITNHFVIPVYAAEEPKETAYVEEQSMEEDNIVETQFIESIESESMDSLEKDTYVIEEGLDLEEDACLSEVATEEIETESETEEELEIFEMDTYVYVNPLYADLFTEGDILSETSGNAGNTFYSEDSFITESEAIAKLRNGMEYRSDVITISFVLSELFEKSTLDRFIEAALAETGISTQGDYLRLNYRGCTSTGTYFVENNQYYYTLDFSMLYYTTYEQEEAVTAEVANVLYGLGFDENTTNYQKIRAIYDWVCSNVSYDHINLKDSTYLLKYSTYAAVIDRTCVCQGYSSLMYRLLRESGISVRSIRGTSDGQRHAWNIVCLDDFYYNIDATWDAGLTNYNYFLRCNDNFADHTRDAEYTSESFYASYPMTASDYVVEEVVDYEIKEADVVLEYEEHEFAAVSLKPEVTVTKNGQTLVQDVDYTVTYSKNYDAGQAIVNVKGIGDYSGQVTKNFTITKHILRKDEITLSFYSAEYTGSAIKPAVTIKYNGKTFVDKSTNWGGVYYQKNINIGTAEVLIETERISSNFEIGVQIINFEIVPIDITKAQVTLDKTSFTYTGTQIQPSVTEVYLKGKGGILTEGTHYTVRYGENLNNGTGYVYIDGKGNYSGTYEYPITISRVGVYNASLTVDVDATELVYNGQAQTPPYTITYNGIPLVEGVDYTVAYYNNVNASGSAYVEVEGMGNFHSKTSRSFRINQASLKNAEITLDKTSYFYTGEMISPKPVVKYGDTILVEDKDYTLGYNDDTEIGTATVTVKGMGNYTSNVALNFEIIDGYQIKDEHVTLEYASHQFTGSDLHPEVTVVVDEEVLIKDKDYTVNYENCFNVLDTPKVTITGIGNWSGTVEKTFSITKVPISDVSITIDSEVHEYTGKEIYPKVTVQYGKYKTIISQMNYSAYYAEYSNNVNITKNDRQAYVKIILDEINVNYEPAHVYVYFDIVGKDIAKNATVTLSNTYFTYTGSANEPKVASVIRGSKTLVEGTDYTVRYENNINAGTGKVHIDGIGIYAGTVTTSFTIAKAQISKANIVVDSTNCIYNGEEQIPDYTVTFNDIELVEGEDYVPSFENNTNAGTATISFMGFKNFQSTTKKNFEIKAASISDAEISLPQDEYVHTGSAITPEPTVVVDGRTLVKDTDYTVSYSNNEKIGVANFEITGVGNYTGIVEKTFEIVGKDISNAVVTLQYSEHKYTGSKLKPTVTVAVDDVLLEKGVDYEVTYSDNQFIYDTPKVTIKGIGSWSGNIEKTFTITPVLEEDMTITLDQYVYEYTGSEICPVVKLKYLSTTYFVYAMSDRYFTWYYNNINVTSGDQKAKVGFYLDDIDPNYENKYVEVEFDIVEKNISDFTVTLEKASYEYTGSNVCPAVVFSTDGENTFVESVDYAVRYENNINAGTAKVFVDGIGGYKGSIEKTFTINPKNINVGVLAYIGECVYDGKEQIPSHRFEFGDYTLVEGVDYDIACENNINVGYGELSVTGKGNFVGTYMSRFRIDAASVSNAEVTLTQDEYVYTGSAITPEPMVIVDGRTLVKNVDYTLTYQDNVNVGTAQITITGKGNYNTGELGNWKYATFEIVATSISNANITLPQDEYFYTGSAIVPEPTVIVDGRTLVKDTDYTVAYNDNVNIGTATIEVTGACNYTGTVEKTFKIVESPYLATGNCGENLKWILEKDGTLKITGSGMMEGYWDGISDWYEYREKITSVEFPEEGLTNIGAHAFNGCVNIKTIDIPEGIEAIELAAFYGCTGLENVEIPSGGIEFSSGAFQGCTNLKSVVLPGDITGMSVNVFADCPNLKYVVINGNALNTYDMTIISEDMEPWFLVPEKATGYDVYPWSEYNIIYGSKVPVNKLSISEVQDFEYTGKVIRQQITISDGDYTLIEDKDYSIEYKDNTNIGTAKIVISGKGWYDGVVNKTFEITHIEHIYDDEFDMICNLCSDNRSTGWKEIDDQWYFFDSQGNMVKNTWIGNYYLKSDGSMAKDEWVDSGMYYVKSSGAKETKTGWLKLDGEYYYLKSGKKQMGWLKAGNYWYYLDSLTGIMCADEWKDATYYFKSNGAMATGWTRIGDDYYYFDNSGVKITNSWISNYYLKADGVMAVNEWVDSGKYYVNASGAKVVKDGWFKINEDYYYLKSGEKQTGWLKAGNQWYYLDLKTGVMYADKWLNNKYYLKTNGAMATEWLLINDDYYYFSSNGEKQTNCWIGNYYLKANGVMAVNEWVDSGRYYVNASGVKVTNSGWFKVNEDYYYLKSGLKQTGWQKIGNIWYYMNPDTGIMLADEWLNNTYYFRSNGAMVTGAYTIDGKEYQFDSSGKKI